MSKPIPSKRKRVFWAEAQKVCVHCGGTEDLTIDHILARVLGGTNDFKNLQVLCRSCNWSKAVGEGQEHERRCKELFLPAFPIKPVLPASDASGPKAVRAEFRRLMHPAA